DPWDIVTIKCRAEAKMMEARLKRPIPYIDKTMYAAWNSMFVSAFLEASHSLITPWIAENCGAFALKTIDRMLKEAWSEDRGFAHRIGGPALLGSLDDQVFGAVALLDAYESTLDPRYFRAAQRTMDIALEKYADLEQGGFF